MPALSGAFTPKTPGSFTAKNDTSKRRYGYRRVPVVLRREGWPVNRKLTYRLYREAGLAVRRRKRKRIGPYERRPFPKPATATLRWSLDFVSDTLTCSRRFRILCVVDDYSRECLALVADTSLSGVRVARELTRLIGLRGKPHTGSAIMAPN